MFDRVEIQVVVVGAGESGLTSIKACREEKVDVVCFEKTNNIGGLWHYRDEVVSGVGSVMRSTVMNTSKEMSAFSDFPPPENFPMYMHNRYTKEYLEKYAQHFHLFNYVMLEHTVMAVAKAEDTSHWIVSVVNQKTGRKFQVVARFLLICTGTNSFPNSSKFAGLDEFNGLIFHSHSIKHAREFEGKTVLVIGAGNSGTDVSVELSHVCKKVYLSMKNDGCWVLPRLVEKGYPLDMFFVRRFVGLALGWMPNWLRSTLAEFKVSQRLDHNLFGFHPKRRFYGGSRVIVNDEICSRLASGTLVLRNEVVRFTRGGVVFKNDFHELNDVDAVIFATGYTVDCPFLEGTNFESDIHNAYKFVFPLEQPQPTIAFVGFIHTLAPSFPVSEMQARWAVQTFLKRCTLPSDCVMRNDVQTTRRRIVAFWGEKASTWPYVDFIPYMDFLAKAIGIGPSFLHMLFRDPRLFLACVFGPLLPYQFRLEGPHAWTGARDAILEAPLRIRASLQTRSSSTHVQDTGKKSSASIPVLFSAVMVVTLSIGIYALSFLN